MARAKKPTAKSKSTAGRKAKGSGMSIDVARLKHIASRSGLAALAIGVIAGWAIGRGPLMDKASEAAEAQLIAASGEVGVPVLHVELDWPSKDAGVRTAQLEQSFVAGIHNYLAQVVGAAASADPFDQTSLEAARQALIDTGWYVDVARVQRLADGVIRVEGTHRREAAVVLEPTYDGSHNPHLVAADGVILAVPSGVQVPPMYAVTSVNMGAPVLSDGTLDRRSPWPGGGVQDAITLIAEVARTPSARYIAGVDLSHYEGRGYLTLITRKGAQLVWGSVPGAGAAGETDDATKLRHLAEVFSPDKTVNERGVQVNLYSPIFTIDRTAGSPVRQAR